jgi:hypothetical protein
MVIVATVYLRFYIEVRIGVGTFFQNRSQYIFTDSDSTKIPSDSDSTSLALALTLTPQP